MSKKFLISLLIISLIIVISSLGYLGSNVDICQYRLYPNNNYRFLEFIGGRLATLTYKSNYLAPYFVSSILFISFFLLINKILKKLSIYDKSSLFTNKQREFYALSITTSTLLIWPFYPYLTNAFRQAVALGFGAFLLNIFISDKFKLKNFLLFIFLILFSFSHRTGLFVVFAYFFSFFQRIFFKTFNFHINKKFSYLISGSIGASIVVFKTKLNTHGISHSPGMDLGIPLAILSILTTIILFLKWDIKRSIFPTEIYNMSIFIALIIILSANNSFASERIFPYLLLTSFPLILESFIIYFRQTIGTIFLLIFLGFSITTFSGQYQNSYLMTIENGRWCSRINE